MNKFIKTLKQCLADELPGKRGQCLMSPKVNNVEMSRKPNKCYKKAGVLLLLFPYKDKLSTVYIVRTEDGGEHSGQICLPGGAVENADNDIIETALRETQEEIGTKKESIEILGSLTPLYVPPSNYCVFPVVGFCEVKPEFIPNPSEVADIIIAPLENLMNPNNLGQETIKNISTKKHEWIAPYYNIAGEHIWGATAMITSEFLTAIEHIDIHRIEIKK